jgi:hypothetical protein
MKRAFRIAMAVCFIVVVILLGVAVILFSAGDPFKTWTVQTQHHRFEGASHLQTTRSGLKFKVAGKDVVVSGAAVAEEEE